MGVEEEDQRRWMHYVREEMVKKAVSVGITVVRDEWKKMTFSDPK